MGKKQTTIFASLFIIASMLLAANATSTQTNNEKPADTPVQPSPLTVLLQEDFSTPWVPCGTGYDAPPGWIVDGICVGENAPNMTHYWSQFNDTELGFDLAKSPPYCAGMWWNNGAGEPYGHNSDEWLISVELNLSEYRDLQVTFYSIYVNMYYGLDPTTHYYVKASTDNGTSWDILADLCHDPEYVFPCIPEEPPNYNWNTWPIVLNLSAYDYAESLKLGWHKVSFEALDSIWTVDDILVEGTYLPIYDHTISMSEGWNLISIPLDQADFSLDQVLGPVAGQWDCVMSYDSQSPAGWKSNCTFRPDTLNDLSMLNTEHGFWINITEPGGTDLTIVGNPLPPTFIQLYAGWNLVGYPSLTERTVADALWGTSANRVEFFDPTAPYLLREALPTDMMEPGRGYWVRVPFDTVWVVN